MSLKDQIGTDLKERMKARDALSVSCMRMILAAIHNREIEKRGDLTDAECAAVLSTLAKQRNESIEMYEKGGRQDLVDKEKAELAIIKSFLPEELSDDELSGIVSEAIAEVGVSGPSDMGKVMKVLIPKVAGRADGRRVSEIVKARLANK